MVHIIIAIRLDALFMRDAIFSMRTKKGHRVFSLDALFAMQLRYYIWLKHNKMMPFVVSGELVEPHLRFDCSTSSQLSANGF